MARGLARSIVFAALLGLGAPAMALDFDLGTDAHLKMVNRFSLGGGVRTQDRHIDALGILNTPGQQDLCVDDDCLSFTGNPAPNQRLLAARGGHFLHANDDGNMNYDQGEVFTALSKLTSDWTLSWGEWVFRSSFIGFFDVTNVGFETRRFNTVVCGADPENCADTNDGDSFVDYGLALDERPRLDNIEHRLGVRGEFREYFATRSFLVGDYEIYASLGNQRLRWGEANLTLLNTLDVINPQDAVLARQPGLALNELNLPVGLFTLGTDLTEGLTVDGWLQYDWEPVRPEPSGSLFSTNDVAGGGNYAIVGQGQYPEDPDALWFSQGSTGLISNSHRTIYVPDEGTYAPDDFGQFGIRAKWYLADFNNGTELGFYFANYHSRLPYLSAYAAQESCLRSAVDFSEAATLCNGFNAASNRGEGGVLAPERCDPRGCNMTAYMAREPLPIDTLRLFLDFPEDIQMYGVSINTTLGGWSFAGEYSYRPNLPAQLLISDIVYAGLQPAIGCRNLPFNSLGTFDFAGANATTASRVGALLGDFAASGDPDAANSVLPGARQIFPDYLSGYRGQDNSCAGLAAGRAVQPGQYIQGYERLKIGQFALTALQLFSTNPFGSDDLLMVYEVGFTHVVDMPERGELYFQGAGDMNHPSPGADCSGFPAGTDCTDTTVVGRINPTQMREGFADDFAWGLRSLWQLSYSNLFDVGLNLKPTILAFWDVEGIAPSPMQNYVEDNRWIVPAFFFEVGEDWSGTLMYQYFAGADNLLGDRDNLMGSISYSF